MATQAKAPSARGALPRISSLSTVFESRAASDTRPRFNNEAGRCRVQGKYAGSRPHHSARRRWPINLLRPIFGPTSGQKVGNMTLAASGENAPSAASDYKIWQVILAAAVGTMIEWYDIYIFGALTAVLA